MIQFAHQHIGISRNVNNLIGIETSDKHPDKVHQVVPCKGQREGECACKNGNFQYIDLQQIEDKHDQAPTHEQEDQQEQDMGLHPSHPFGRNNIGTFQAFEYGKIGDRRQGNSAPNRTKGLQLLLIAEREDQPRNIHDNRTADKGNHHRKQNTTDNHHRIARVDHIAHRRLRTIGQRRQRATRDFEYADSDRCTQQSEDKRNGCGGWHSEGIEDIEQNHIREHHGQKQQHDFGECKHFGMEHPATCDLHHSAGGQCSDNNSDGRHRHDNITGGHLRAQRRVQKVHRIVRDTDNQAKNSQRQHNDHDNKVQIHNRLLFGF